MTRIQAIVGGTALVAVLGFMQMEIQTVHDDVQDIKRYLIYTSEKVAYNQQDMYCLAKNIYHEAGVESLEGKFAVAQVTINRLKEGRWGRDICSVVYARSQFSWTLSKKKRNEQPKGPLWEESQMVAHSVLKRGARVPSLKDSTYYHADYVQPVWRRSVVKIQQVGQHIFYKKPSSI